MTTLDFPAQIQWALLPTRLERLTRYSETLPGVDVWIKRDDQTGFCLSGNKVRKLEFSLARAISEGASGVLTCGGVQSNHCRATVYLAARLGLSTHILLRTADGQPPEKLEGNALLCAIGGATITWVSPEEYAERAARMDEYADRSARGGRPLAIIPEGASDGLGSIGFVKAAQELQEQLGGKSLRIDAVVHAIGSGGTTAGLTVGSKLVGTEWKPHAFTVCDDAAHFRQRVAEIGGELAELGFDAGELTEEHVEIHDGYQGEAYGATTREELTFYRELARREGILLDPCYTGKAFFGMDSEIRRGTFPPGSRVLFWHTGGGFANFAYHDEWATVL